MVLGGLRLVKSLIFNRTQKKVQFIKARRLRWLGHVERMPEERDVKNINNWKLIALRAV
jgi:hypothetical protein